MCVYVQCTHIFIYYIYFLTSKNFVYNLTFCDGIFSNNISIFPFVYFAFIPYSQDKQKRKQFASVAGAMESFCCIEVDVCERQSHNTFETEQAIHQFANELVKARGASLFDVGQCLSNLGQQMVKQGPSSSVSLQVLVTRTLQNGDSPYSVTTSLSGLSGGEIQILMTLCAIHLSGADTVILDEPGHSLHPPQQAQMRRWIETQRPRDQVCVVVTHSTEFISPQSLSSLYHMSFVGSGFTSFRLCLPGQGSGPSGGNTVTGKSESSSALVAGAGGRGSGPSDGGTLTDRKAESSSAPVGGGGEASTSQKLPKQVTLTKESMAMLMRPEMRKMFFATGLYFVEGETDKRVLSALRHCMMEDAGVTKETSDDLHDFAEAMKVQKMDQWDILALGGCAEALRAYNAAKDLKIPCAVVLDFDVITVKDGKKIKPFNSDNLKKSRLYKQLEKGKKTGSLPVAETVLDEVEEVLSKGTLPPAGTSLSDFEDKELLENILKVFQKYGFWIWEGDLETTLCDNSEARQKFMEIKDFFEAIEIKHFCSFIQGDHTEDSSSTSEESDWHRVKQKLHGGGWMRLPWEALLEVVKVCLQTKPSPLADFCDFMKRWQ